jgi:hypothetical protein
LDLAGAAPLTGCQRKAGCRRAARGTLLDTDTRSIKVSEIATIKQPRVLRIVALFDATNSAVW